MDVKIGEGGHSPYFFPWSTTLFTPHGEPEPPVEELALNVSSPSIRPPSMDPHPLHTLQADPPPDLNVPGKLISKLPSARLVTPQIWLERCPPLGMAKAR